MRIPAHALGWMISLMSLAVQAQTSTPSSTGANASNWLGGAWFGLVTLTMVIVLAAVVLWLYRRGTPGASSTAGIQILATYPLGPRERLLVVRVQDRILALGQTPAQITMLTELESFEVTDNEAIAGGAFAQQLQSLLRFRGAK